MRYLGTFEKEIICVLRNFLRKFLFQKLVKMTLRIIAKNMQLIQKQGFPKNDFLAVWTYESSPTACELTRCALSFKIKLIWLLTFVLGQNWSNRLERVRYWIRFSNFNFRSALQSGYFEPVFKRIMEKEAYSDPVKLRRQLRVAKSKKNIGKAFLPSNYPKSTNP